MALSIDYKQKNEKSDTIKLAKLINKIPALGSYVGELYLLGESIKEDKKLTKEKQISELRVHIDDEFKFNTMIKHLEKVQIDLFKREWVKLYNKDKLSELLEELIADYGSVDIYMDPLEYSREARVYHSNRDSNFDVIFFENTQAYTRKNLGEKIEIDKKAEFHECKTNICNHFPADKQGQMKRQTRNKIEFIEDIKKYLDKEKFTYKIYMPTFYENVEGTQDYLNHHGYEYIEVLPYMNLIDCDC